MIWIGTLWITRLFGIEKTSQGGGALGGGAVCDIYFRIGINELQFVIVTIGAAGAIVRDIHGTG